MALEASFKDQNLTQLARLKLTKTRQGKHSLVQFFQQFEFNAEQAGYTPNSATTGYDAFLVELLEDLVNHEIISQIYMGGPTPPQNWLVAVSSWYGKNAAGILFFIRQCVNLGPPPTPPGGSIVLPKFNPRVPLVRERMNIMFGGGSRKRDYKSEHVRPEAR
ncbi:hypothetical protein B0H13DRAFT_1871268 [Mycena leptocephala]|nr:hypothetical protein B0H13DRAFT_1871268 [Mycena leptocephala]